ncbi:cupin domain-containing protein [Bradymonas sediminis]|uniref:Uncharacterized protein n=1 Tax=Bradymonas sediminis TaxID=1548548 RepID=A0A2Z4FKA1_9DELT|nr:cupin domain-containing protein [Bradymonas sediminis]AWV89397.1 hypothetical protein DN745_08630 [Bradymonas sediminis]TDP73578.1 cupin domain [Bradymonas sediminis]
MTTKRSEPSERLRAHPAERFADDERILDLAQCTQTLLSEDHKAVDGHRQYTLSRSDTHTTILFHFEKGSRIPEHMVRGDVSIHVLDGQLEVETPSQTHRLKAEQILVLAAGVKHDVHALSETRMLLTVQLTPKQKN